MQQALEHIKKNTVPPANNPIHQEMIQKIKYVVIESYPLWNGRIEVNGSHGF